MKNYYLLAFILVFSTGLSAQDTANKFSNSTSRFQRSVNKLDAYYKNIFSKFTHTQVSLTTGMGLARQNIKSLPPELIMNYPLDGLQNKVFKPGYFASARLEGQISKTQLYAVSLELRRLVTGSNYKVALQYPPTEKSFSSFAADDRFWIVSIPVITKKMLPVSDTSRYKFYAVAGPSLDIRISGVSEDNQRLHHYRKMFVSALIGVEFDYLGYYTLFLHYQKSLSSLTRNGIRVGNNQFSLGMMMTIHDLFD
jgi:hypothetical protein